MHFIVDIALPLRVITAIFQRSSEWSAHDGGYRHAGYQALYDVVVRVSGTDVASKISIMHDSGRAVAMYVGAVALTVSHDFPGVLFSMR